MMRSAEEIVDDIYKKSGLSLKLTPMEQEMKDILSDRMVDDIGQRPLYEVLDAAIHDILEEGNSNAPGGMVYTKEVDDFFLKHRDELSMVARDFYPDREDPYFLGNKNRTWAVQVGFEQYLDKVLDKVQGKEDVINSIPVEKKAVIDLRAEEKSKKAVKGKTM